MPVAPLKTSASCWSDGTFSPERFSLSAVTSAKVISQTLPLPVVVRSTFPSCMMMSPSSFVIRTSVSKPRTPALRHFANPPAALSSYSPRLPRCDTIIGFSASSRHDFCAQHAFFAQHAGFSHAGSLHAVQHPAIASARPATIIIFFISFSFL